MKTLLRWFNCFFFFHKFETTLASSGNLEVRECKNCKTHLNIHHGWNASFVSRRLSILEDIKEMQRFDGETND